jgi:hypothetical protein
VIPTALYQLEQHIVSDPAAHFFLLKMTPTPQKKTGSRRRSITRPKTNAPKLKKRIARDNKGDAVLVSVDPFASLRRAYPNYFQYTRLWRTS